MNGTRPRLVTVLVTFLFVLASTIFTFAQSDDPKKTEKPVGDSDKQVTTPVDPKKEAAEKKKKEDAAKKAAKSDKDAKKEEEKPKDPMSSGTFDGLRFRSIGPAMISGRISSFAVNPKNPSQYYVGVASGGVWRTDNNGTTWAPVFEGEGAYSIGTVVMDPNDSNVIWVGTGENNNQRSVAYGDGIYRSDDGGKSWKNMGLKNSEHIARIVIDPRDSKVIYAAAYGPLWGPGGDRGVYKSTDGGKTWEHSLKISENTGVADLVMDPTNPDVLFAAAHQRRRHVFTLVHGGPESALYKSNDAGKTWNKVTSGLPSVEMGRIGLGIAASDPNTMYALVEAADGKGGLFRSKDRGASWEKRNPYNPTPMYYSTLFIDPKNADRVYIMGTLFKMTNDGGKTLVDVPAKYVHVDHHAMWINPKNSDHMLLGNDGGIYTTYDGGQHWDWTSNLPLAQFYNVNVDNSSPFYYVYGGTQDNNSIGGPSRTRSGSGILNGDWFITNPGDGFKTQIDPEDPNTVYAQSQYGGLVRYDRGTGEIFGIQPPEGKGEPPLRWNWESPLIISPHSRTRLYFGANKLFRSDDRGDTWKAVSGDLTRQMNRDALPVMGKIWGPDTVAKHNSTSFYGNITALSESPLKEGLIYVGTDDGLIQVTADGGATWRKVEKAGTVPERTFVDQIFASQHDANTVYAVFDNHKNADFKPYVMKSTDAGATWRSIAANLPERGDALAIAEDPVNANLLFVGTEFGVHFSNDGGGKWVQLKGGLPTISVRDLAIQKREGDLVLGTFGRGFYVLDDLAALRQLTPQTLEQPAVLVAPRKTMMFIESLPLSGYKNAFHGDSMYAGDNPPYGVTFTYYLKDKFKSAKELRQEREKEAAKKNETGAYSTLKYPTPDELRAEAEAEAPSVWLMVMDTTGQVIRRVAATNAAGFQRVTWDLRFPMSELPEESFEAGIFPWEFGNVGPLVMPGDYTAKLARWQDGKWSDLTQPVKFNVFVEGEEKMTASDRADLHKFQREASALHRAASGAVSAASEMQSELKTMRRALRETAADTSALQLRVDSIDRELRKLMIALNGDSVLRARQEPTPYALIDRINTIMSDQRMSTARPSQTHRQHYAIVSEELNGVLTQLRNMRSQIAEIEQEMERIGTPWTPGRIPTWQPAR